VDWQRYDQVIGFISAPPSQMTAKNITVDPNLLMYIYTNETHQTYAYDKTDKFSTNVTPGF
jgi:hypothetical protein